MEYNVFQTPVESIGLNKYPEEVRLQYDDFTNNVPFIKSMLSPDRLRAKDLPRDSDGKIIVDLERPHILEDMDYFRPTAINFQRTGKLSQYKPNGNPNSEYGAWIREEVRRCLEGYVRESDGEWITGDYYFFLNYCPIQLSKRTKGKKANRVVDFPFVWDGHYLKSHYLNRARMSGKHAWELARRGAGKAHPYDEKVYTPDGLKRWGDIKVGDTLFGEDGKPTKVIYIPFDGETPIFRVHFANGYSVDCSKGHLWKVKSHSKKGVVILSTEELLDIYKRPRKVTPHNPKGYELDCSVPLCGKIEFDYKQTKIDPYTFGLLLGDGCFRCSCVNTARITTSEEDFSVYEKYIPYHTKHHKSNRLDHSIIINGFGDILKEYGLYFCKSNDKFIPDEYKYNSSDVRISILKGIFDTDSNVQKGKGYIDLTLSSKRLIDDIRWILSSLGINHILKKTKKTFYKDKDGNRIDCLDGYRISVFSNIELFNLPRKLNEWNNRSRTNYGLSKYMGTKITNIEYIGQRRSKCVTVDNDSHCYLINNFIVTHNSFYGGSMLAKRFILGESFEVNKRVQCVVTASERKYLTGANQILDMFQSYIDFCATYTEWPYLRLMDSKQSLQWIMGYKDVDTGVSKGTLNSVMGISSKDDDSKLRGSRGVLYLLEEVGTFAHLLDTYNTMRPSVEDGDNVFGMLYGYGTAGSNESDFSSAQEIMYNPDGYNILSLDNVFDKVGQGRNRFCFFFPGYLNRAECYDSNGNSDVSKALIEILNDRYITKYNSTDPNTITRRIAEIPITPQEAVLRTTGNLFPVADLNARLNQLDNNTSEFNDVYIGDLATDSKGEMKFIPTGGDPIRVWPTKDNKVEGAIEFFAMPEKDANGKVFPERYVMGHDPVDSDEADTMSLTSTFVLDLWTDRIVAEYTGRHDYADDNFETVRKLCIFYNAKVLYESNRKGIFAYFQKMNSLYMLADTPEYLKDRQLIKAIGYGNSSKGVHATAPINNYADMLIKEWLIKPVVINVEENGIVSELTVKNLTFIKNRALLQELVAYNPFANFDRIRALGMLMLYREQYMVAWGGEVRKRDSAAEDKSYLGNDDFFGRNYRGRD